MKQKLLLSIALWSITTNFIFAQIQTYTVVQISENGTPSFINFDSKAGVTNENFKEKLKKDFNLQPNDDFTLLRKSSDKLGFTHYKYNQTYKGVNVFGAVYIFNEKDNVIESASGKFIPKLSINITPTITKEIAIQKAKEQMQISVCRWENSEAEEKLKKAKKNPNATYYPKPVLEIVSENGDSKNYRLAWKFNISGLSMDKAWTVYIDAENGNLIYKNSLTSFDTPGTVQTYYNGVRSIKCLYNSPYYLLAETQRGALSNQSILTLTANHDSLPSDGGNIWATSQYIGSSTTTFTNDPVANNVHWGIEQAYDFYALFGRKSFDDNGTYIANLVHYKTNYNNAFWSGYDTVMCYGDGDGSVLDYVVGLDVAGHEFTHAITSYEANLQYVGQSGALNESFSDIFGTGIEWYTLGAGSNWGIGENVALIAPYYLRSMNNPNSGLDPQPDTYTGTHWAPTSSGDPDNGGVHINSGVQNFWFYLLAAGGSGTNDLGYSYSVTGIGMSDALNIAYRNLTVYLGPNSNYNDARLGSIQSATDFWGASSTQVQSVKNAWCAVGVGTCSTAGIHEYSNNLNYNLYPNPAKGKVSIIMNQQSSELKVNITNSLGQIVLTENNIDNNGIIDLEISKLNNGVYFVTVSSKNESKTQKLIIAN